MISFRFINKVEYWIAKNVLQVNQDTTDFSRSKGFEAWNYTGCVNTEDVKDLSVISDA